MSDKQFDTRVVVYTERSDLRAVVRQELKGLGVSDPALPSDSAACISELIRDKTAAAVLDWKLGTQEIVKILSASRAQFKIDTRSIFIFAPEVDDNVMGIALEYGVTHVHTGEISTTTIKDALKQLISDGARDQQARAVLSMVAESRKEEDWSKATPILAELAAKNPDDETTACEYAENLIHDGNWELAGTILEPLTQSATPNIRAQHLHARVLLQKGAVSAATALLRQAKLANPFNVDRLLELGNILFHEGEVEEAQINFDEARALQPGNKDATLGAAKCRLISEEINEGLALVRQVSGPRELAAVFNTTAILAMHNGNFENGMRLYQAALKAVAADKLLQSKLLFNMGVGYRRWKKPEKAIDCFDQALAIDPNFAKAQRQKEQVSKAVPLGKVLIRGAPPPPSGNIDEENFAEFDLAGPRTPREPQASQKHTVPLAPLANPLPSLSKKKDDDDF